ncbi:MAG: hypothetical protein GTO18_14985 [Anaerolineales bacterium]|nr:hypothetical protein [Anaerolineales bacterium]
MKGLKPISLVLTFTLIIIIASSCTPCPECPEPPPVPLCVGFREYGPGQSFSNPYEQLRFTFSISPGPKQFETSAIDDLSGLTVESNGLRIDLLMGTHRTWNQAAVPRTATALPLMQSMIRRTASINRPFRAMQRFTRSQSPGKQRTFFT